jgi:CubicO group peptidase (beta-lactamase class C family)
VSDWTQDADNYDWGWGEIYLTARDMAKFGLLYLNDGEYEGNQVISADWVHDSLRAYSEDAKTYKVGRNFRDTKYGYQWWSAKAGDHRFDLAWGHGGQLIALVDELDIIVVTTADPLHDIPPGDYSWKREKAILNLVADFIASLPSE